MTADLARRKELGLIHAAKKALAIEDESYRALLRRVTGRESAADLDAGQRSKAIDELRRLGFRYDATKKRRAQPAAAVASLVGKIRALWLSLWQLGELEDASERALAGFIARQAKVDDARFLTVLGANQVIEGLKARCERAGFVQPTVADAAKVDGWRANAAKPAGGVGFTARVRLIERQWRILIELGALDHGIHASPGSWLTSRFKVSVPWYLADNREADSAIEQLGAWIRRVKANAGPQA